MKTLGRFLQVVLIIEAIGFAVFAFTRGSGWWVGVGAFLVLAAGLEVAMRIGAADVGGWRAS